MEELRSHIDNLVLLLSLPVNRLKFNEAIEADPALRERAVTVFCDGAELKTVSDIHKRISSLKNKTLDHIINCFSPLQAGYIIAAKCADIVVGPEKLKDTIGDLVSQRFFTRKQEAASIMALMSLMNISDELAVEVNHNAGVNQGFVVSMKDGSKKFVKNFADDAATAGKIDPNELFVYKTMEYMQLGPVTQFLIHQYSIGHGTAIHGNFIATDDLNTAGWTFYLDSSEHVDLFSRALSTSMIANVELSALSTINDVLLLSDTFGQNPGNYGLLHRIDANGADEYRFMVVDHLPFTNNATFPPYRFSQGEVYSPRASVQKRIDFAPARMDEEVALHRQRGLSHAPVELGRAAYPREQIDRAVYARLAGLLDAVRRSLDDVMEVIDAHERSFCAGARDRVNDYVRVIQMNIEKLKTM